MTDIPNGLYWSKDEAEKALAKHTFIRVSKSDKRSMRQITGAERVWSIPENRDEIYIAAFRVSGKPEDIKVALSSAGYSADTISKYLSSARYKITERVPFFTLLAISSLKTFLARSSLNSLSSFKRGKARFL